MLQMVSKKLSLQKYAIRLLTSASKKKKINNKHLISGLEEKIFTTQWDIWVFDLER